MLNLVALMGRLTADPELRKTPSDIPVTTITLAVDRGFGEKKTTSFIDVVAWRSTAEFVCKHFSKGQMIALGGFIQVRRYTDKDGTNRKSFEVVAENVYFTESKGVMTAEPKKDDGTIITADDDLPF